jgi:hypothetical protein
MTPRHLYTIRWTQPYATDRLRPYLRHLQEELEQVIETLLEHKKFDDANKVIDRIRAL